MSGSQMDPTNSPSRDAHITAGPPPACGALSVVFTEARDGFGLWWTIQKASAEVTRGVHGVASAIWATGDYVSARGRDVHPMDCRGASCMGRVGQESGAGRSPWAETTDWWDVPNRKRSRMKNLNTQMVPNVARLTKLRTIWALE